MNDILHYQTSLPCIKSFNVHILNWMYNVLSDSDTVKTSVLYNHLLKLKYILNK